VSHGVCAERHSGGARSQVFDNWFIYILLYMYVCICYVYISNSNVWIGLGSMDISPPLNLDSIRFMMYMFFRTPRISNKDQMSNRMKGYSSMYIYVRTPL